MKSVLLIGLGRFGRHTAAKLHELGHQVFAVDRREENVRAVLILAPALAFYILEYPGLPGGERVLSALFQSVTARTAGFNTTDYTDMSETGRLLTILLMLIGGSPGSTAGGMKTTTIAVLCLSAAAVFRRRERETAFGRSIPKDTLRAAAAILAAYLTLFLTASAVLCWVESLPLLSAMFEAASAIGTVGLSLGVTPGLGLLSKLLLIFLMYYLPLKEFGVDNLKVERSVKSNV